MYVFIATKKRKGINKKKLWPIGGEVKGIKQKDVENKEEKEKKKERKKTNEEKNENHSH